MANYFERSPFGNGVAEGSGGNVVSNVSNLYGPRQEGGVNGVVKTEGAQNEATVDFNENGPLYDEKIIPSGSIITDVQAYGISGTVDVVTVGGTDVSGAADDDKLTWVEADGELIVEGPTAGKVVVKYRHLAGA